MRLRQHLWPLLAAVGVPVIASAGFSDRNVAVVASADPAYTRLKFDAAGNPRTESYVFMEGSYFEGSIIDPGIEKTPFRRIAEFLALELARQRYFPTREIAAADLLIIVHWGTTRPHLGDAEMTGQTSRYTDMSNNVTTLNRDIQREQAEAAGSDTTLNLLALSEQSDGQIRMDLMGQMTERLSGELALANNVTLLGYARDLNRLRKAAWSTEEEKTLRHDLSTERYFIILKAYDLRAKLGDRRLKPVWSVHMNMRSPGNAFRTAVSAMGAAASRHVGRTTDSVQTVRPKSIPDVKVEVGTPVIVGEPAK